MLLLNVQYKKQCLKQYNLKNLFISQIFDIRIKSPTSFILELLLNDDPNEFLTWDILEAYIIV